jgi:hypothetical protein
MESTLNWIENWFQANCDGDWEHEYGVEITTTDNPGWMITADIKGTIFESIVIEYKLVEQNEMDWYGYSIVNSKFVGVGDPRKLSFLLDLFKSIVEKC